MRPKDPDPIIFQTLKILGSNDSLQKRGSFNKTAPVRFPCAVLFEHVVDAFYRIRLVVGDFTLHRENESAGQPASDVNFLMGHSGSGEARLVHEMLFIHLRSRIDEAARQLCPSIRDQEAHHGAFLLKGKAIASGGGRHLRGYYRGHPMEDLLNLPSLRGSFVSKPFTYAGVHTFDDESSHFLGDASLQTRTFVLAGLRIGGAKQFELILTFRWRDHVPEYEAMLRAYCQRKFNIEQKIRNSKCVRDQLSRVSKGGKPICPVIRWRGLREIKSLGRFGIVFMCGIHGHSAPSFANATSGGRFEGATRLDRPFDASSRRV
jgi:hypothetical protein